MKSVLEALVYGEISPLEDTLDGDSHYDSIVKTISECEQKLFSVLDDESKELMTKFSSAHAEANEMINVDKFAYGFRLGVLMMMEVFAGKEGVVFGKEGSV